jgi:hypothetical protein
MKNGLAVFDLIWRHGALTSAVHCAFVLFELDGKDLRPSLAITLRNGPT